MTDQPSSANRRLVDSLMERAKELSTLYRVEAVLSDAQRPLGDVLRELAEAIPAGMQFPKACEAQISCRDLSYSTDRFTPSPCSVTVDIVVRGVPVGQITAAYRHEVPPADRAGFLAEEVQLLETIANRIAQRVLFERLRDVFEVEAEPGGGRRSHGWRAAVEMLRKIDQGLLVRVARKMMNHLLLRGFQEASGLLHSFGQEMQSDLAVGEANQPQPRASLEKLQQLPVPGPGCGRNENQQQQRRHPSPHRRRTPGPVARQSTT